MSGLRLEQVQELLRIPKQPATDAERADFAAGEALCDRLAARIQAGEDADLIISRELLGNPEFVVRGIVARLLKQAGKGLASFEARFR